MSRPEEAPRPTAIDKFRRAIEAQGKRKTRLKENFATAAAFTIGTAAIASTILTDIIVRSTRPGRKAELDTYKSGTLLRRHNLKGQFASRFGKDLTVAGNVGLTNIVVKEDGPPDARRVIASYGPGLVRRRLKTGTELTIRGGGSVTIDPGQTIPLENEGIEITFDDSLGNSTKQ